MRVKGKIEPPLILYKHFNHDKLYYVWQLSRLLACSGDQAICITISSHTVNVVNTGNYAYFDHNSPLNE